MNHSNMTQTTTSETGSTAPSAPTPGAAPTERPRRGALGDPHVLFAGLGTALLAGLTGWFSLLSWRGMADEPSRYTGPLFTAALLIALVGWGVRRFTSRAWLALLAQLVVLAVWVEHRVSGGLPRPSGFRQVWNGLVDGADAAQRYASPVSVTHPEFHFLLLVSGIGILLAVDLVVCGLRRASLGGLPLLLAITISASVLLDPVDWLVFLLTGFGWLALVAIQETDRASSWGRGGAVSTRLSAVGGLAARIALTSGLIAVVFSSALSSEGRTFGSFGQNGGNSSINVSNPLLDLRRNLVQGKDIPLVYVKTDDSAPSYLRTTVLDDFTGSSWQPTDRDFDSTSPIGGQLPPPPGLTSTAPVTSHTWQIRVSESFGSQWLPLPYPSSKLDVDDKWRYDPETLDVIGVGNTNASGLTYNATALSPRIDSTVLRRAAAPPASLRARMTDLPNSLPAVFQRTAREVTKTAKNDFDRAVLLQDWFRSDGGFEYSLRPSSGTGASTLQKFITTDRVGYCEQFSAAMAVMARTLNIPARIAVGFLRADRDKDQYVFSAHDLHAWPELYFDGVGWIVFEPTPQSRTSSPPSYTTTLGQQSPTEAPSAAASATAQPTNQRPDVLPENNGTAANQQGNTFNTWLIVSLAVLLLILLGLLPRVLRDSTSRRRWSTAHSAEALADAAWSEVRATAVDLDLDWSDQRTVRANGQVVQREVVPTYDGRRAIDDVVTYVELTRYARPRELSEETRARIEKDVDTWREAVYKAVDRKRARRARWFPRSVTRLVTDLLPMRPGWRR